MKIVGQLVGHSRRTQTPILRLVSISEFVRQEPLGLPHCLSVGLFDLEDAS